MVPRADVEELVDVVVGPEIVDVLLIVEGGLVSVQSASLGGKRRVRQLGEIVEVPCVGVDELVDVIVCAEVVDVLLVVEDRMSVVDGTSVGLGGRRIL